MSKRASRRARVKLGGRRENYKKHEGDRGYKRPGSLNPKKQA